MARKKDYIAVFDSGVGGISVLRELVKRMPGERYLYFGDSANAPYGAKTTEEVRQLTMEAAKMLFDRGAKALVVACNTATAAAIIQLRETYPDRIIVGIEPAVKLAADRCSGGHVGVMATAVTLREEKFNLLLERFPDLQVTPIYPAELVRLVETGAEEAELEAYLRTVLAPYAGQLDAVVLGCTHYPFAAASLKRVLGENVALLDGGDGTARETRRRLAEKGLLREGEGEVIMENSANRPELLALSRQLLGE